MKQLKLVYLLVALACLLLGTMPATAAPAAPYQLVNYTIDGGGQLLGKRGDRFQLSGTIGQPDGTAALTLAHYTLVGGFWGAANQVNAANTTHFYLPLIIR